MACMDSSDRDCKNCECCLDCLPMAAKCGVLAHPSATQQHYIFVGVYNHGLNKVNALTDVILKLDPQFAQTDLPSSWLADLYDPFRDLTKVANAGGGEVYPEGEQFIYELSPGDGEEVQEQVRIFRDRMTLLHIPNSDWAEVMHLSFTGSNITHILVSTHTAPKTLFDFNSFQQVTPGRPQEIRAEGEPALWCAIFGGADGWANVRASKTPDPSLELPLSSSATCIIGFLVLLLVVTCLYGTQTFGECMGLDDPTPVWERLWCFVTRQAPHEQTMSLTAARSDSLGFVSSDAIDRTIEDQFLHRGGMIRDDGI